ncbi:MAG: hypothetical protein K8J31_28770, partial [Anaerolineae bacterium]|nr:hypothetical protein [Anaerolineae bacterium]
MTPPQNAIRWGLIIRSSIIAALIAIIIILVLLLLLQQNPSTLLDSVCPPTLGQVQPPAGANIVELIVGAIVSAIIWVAICAVVLTIYGLIIYFPLAIILALLLVGSRVQDRRILHIVLTVLISIPVAAGLFFGLARLL